MAAPIVTWLPNVENLAVEREQMSAAALRHPEVVAALEGAFKTGGNQVREGVKAVQHMTHLATKYAVVLIITDNSTASLVATIYILFLLKYPFFNGVSM